MKIGIPDQQDHPLAPNRPLAPITWRQAPAEPHGFYDRQNYANGWNDAVIKAQAEIADLKRQVEAVLGQRDSYARRNRELEEQFSNLNRLHNGVE